MPAAARGAEGKAAPSERITLGVIGIGPRATYDLGGMLKQPDCQCVAVCDVQASRRDAGKRLIDKHYGNKDCVLYRDFRELLARRDIDAVLIATGDRWHAPASILAAKAGKDVYSEKPCGLTIGLCQALDDAIQKTGRVFQAGTQRRSVANFQAAVRLAQSGKLGKLHTLFASVYTPSIETTWLPGEPTPPRDVVDWDLWLGPAPWRPYNHRYVEGGWRGYWDFDSGARLLDWGAHTVDLCQWANGADDTGPVEYEAVGQDDQRPLCQRREAGARLPGDALRPASGLGPVAGDLPGAVRGRRGLGRDGRQRRHRGASGVAQGGAEGRDRQARGRARRLGPRPELLRLRQVAAEAGGQFAGHAPLAHRLPRGRAGLDPQAEAQVRSGERRVHRRRRGQRPSLASGAGPLGRVIVASKPKVALPFSYERCLPCVGLQS